MTGNRSLIDTGYCFSFTDQEKYLNSHFALYNMDRPSEVYLVRVALGFGQLATRSFVAKTKVRESVGSILGCA